MIKSSDKFYRCVASSLRAAVLDRNNCCCFIAKVKGAEPARKSRQPCAFCFACKLLKNAYFAILANSLQINQCDNLAAF